MYKIIGTDQKEYGPVSSDQIQQWLAQGRVNAQTRIQADGGEWKTLGDLPEFPSFIGSRVPPLASPPNPIPPSAQPTKTSGLAIASLVLGILGIVERQQTNKSNGALGGGGIALAGTIVSAIFLLFVIPLSAAMILPALAKAKQRALSIQCINNMRQLSLAAHMYAAEHGDRLPSSENWCDAEKQYVGGNTRVYQCPAADSADRCDYAFNSQLSGVELKNANPQTVLIFESDPGWNSSGGSELMLKASRHGRTFAVAFVDGHVEQVTYARLAQLRWEP